MIKLTASSVISGGEETFKFDGTVKDGVIKYNDGDDITVRYTNDSLAISNGLNLILNSMTESLIEMEIITLKLKTKLINLIVEKNMVDAIYEMYLDGELIDKRNICYRW